MAGRSTSFPQPRAFSLGGEGRDEEEGTGRRVSRNLGSFAWEGTVDKFPATSGL